jgi:hypothetical protein
MPSGSRVVLQLEIERGSSNTSKRDLDKANTELSEESHQYTKVGELMFLSLHEQGTTIFLTNKTQELTSPIVDPLWDRG